MSNKKRPSIAETLLHVVTLVPNLVNLATNVTSLLNVELRLAGRNIMMLVTLSVLFALLLMTTWLGVLTLLFIYLTSLQLSMAASVAFLMLLNIIVMMFLFIFLMRAKTELFFPRTSREISRFE